LPLIGKINRILLNKTDIITETNPKLEKIYFEDQKVDLGEFKAIVDNSNMNFFEIQEINLSASS
jgi:hypothetical protein